MWDIFHRFGELSGILTGLPALGAVVVVFWKRFVAYRDAILRWSLAAFAVLYLVSEASRLGFFGYDSFAKGWPDAIQCSVNLPGNATKSTIIFRYYGTRSAAGLTKVAAYMHVGGFNSVQVIPTARPSNNGVIGYAPNEFWFTDDDQKELVEPDRLLKLGDAIDGIDRVYIASYLRPADCGGKTMSDLVNSGNAFYFAKRL